MNSSNPETNFTQKLHIAIAAVGMVASLGVGECCGGGNLMSRRQRALSVVIKPLFGRNANATA